MRQNPLSFLFVFAALAVLPNLSTAQVVEVVDAAASEVLTVREAALLAEEKRIRTLIKHGPHRKNRLAAGRGRTLRRAARVKPVPVMRARVSRPAFGKELRVRTSARLLPRKPAPRLYGPQYKNRGAKLRSGRG
ncbi:hypothetical protein [Lewinella sp. JB7]|uniref:hypothetical protein n=1 Tax=Lewinella sp. JB7 TaxID=2962887 RepID=UPI0020CA1FDC|nr:hypothetical protein [Lewinella sp. JB7]MCP9234797.1 hypothetical protein [Lewinella sp. JB7]